MTVDTDVLVVGAGVIGLAVGERLARAGRSVMVLEAADRVGSGTSSRNSACIHAGIYYKSDTLKAKLCLEGKERLYRWCDAHGVAAKRCGKLVIASTQEGAVRLEGTLAQGRSNGLEDLVLLDGAQVKALEPALACAGAVLSPSSGVVDTHELMLSLVGAGQSAGMQVVLRTPVAGAEPVHAGWNVRTGGTDPTTITARVVVNAAGLSAIDLSRTVFPARHVPTLHPTKGCYLRFDGRSPLSHIVYPDLIPGMITERADATPDVHGVLRFGPSVEPTAGPGDVAMVDGLVDRLAPAIQRYLPGLDIARLVPDFAGVRPKIYGMGEPPADFGFDWGGPGWLDLWGLESPALTASLAIAEHVWGLVDAAGLAD